MLSQVSLLRMDLAVLADRVRSISEQIKAAPWDASPEAPEQEAGPLLFELDAFEDVLRRKLGGSALVDAIVTAVCHAGLVVVARPDAPGRVVVAATQPRQSDTEDRDLPGAGE